MVPLNPAGTYMVTVNSFLADGGDNLDTFGTVTSTRALGGGNDHDALIEHFDASPVAPPSTNRLNEIP